MLIVTNEIKIRLSEFEFSYVRSSGPGGQNVNKVNSKAVLRWNPHHSPALPLAVLHRFLARFARKLNIQGELIISSDQHRDQAANRQECLRKLSEMLREVARPPKLRHKTKPKFSSIEKRKTKKRQRGEKKLQRKTVKPYDSF